MNLTLAYSSVHRHLESWSGYKTLMEALNRFEDLQVFIAGGVIRNCLIESSLQPKDFDFFLQGTSVKPAVELFAKNGQLDATPYGAPRWHPISNPKQYADLMSIDEFVPGLWKCEDIIDVLNQFDFTANAVAFDLRTGEAFDPQNGYRDALRRTMKMVRFDYPEGPFILGATLSRNAILWFRILHFACMLGFTIEPVTLEWLNKHRAFNHQLEAFSRMFFRPKPGYLDPLNE
jgi:tRNA nucleotidyltransferase/poly(A) polymerase